MSFRASSIVSKNVVVYFWGQQPLEKGYKYYYIVMLGGL